jgi:F-type H+-transporting ATPase subunit epsilon
VALSLEIVTPEQRVLAVEADEVRLTGLDGGFGIRPGHTPLVAALAAGELVFISGGSSTRYAVGEGFAEVSNDRVRVLVEEAIPAASLDAGKAAAEAEELRKKFAALSPDDPSYETQKALVDRAQARANVAASKH